MTLKLNPDPPRDTPQQTGCEALEELDYSKKTGETVDLQWYQANVSGLHNAEIVERLFHDRTDNAFADLDTVRAQRLCFSTFVSPIFS